MRRAALNTTIQNRKKKSTIRRMINSPIIILDIVPPFGDLLEKWMRRIKNNLKKIHIKINRMNAC
jgi:hypothetical protein